MIQSASIYLEWIGLVFGILYVVSAAKENSICWIFSIISTVCISIEDFIHTKLYFDGILHVFYVIIAILGLYTWRSAGASQKKLFVSRLRWSRHLVYLFFSITFSIGLGYIISQSTDAAMPYLDCFTTTISVVGTFLLIYKIIDSWAYFSLSNLIMIYLYYVRGAELFSLLYLVFFIVSIYGLFSWSKNLRPGISTS